MIRFTAVMAASQRPFLRALALLSGLALPACGARSDLADPEDVAGVAPRPDAFVDRLPIDIVDAPTIDVVGPPDVTACSPSGGINGRACNATTTCMFSCAGICICVRSGGAVIGTWACDGGICVGPLAPPELV